MRAGVKDSLVPRVSASLKLLGLIDESGNPTAELEGLRRAAEGEYRARLEAIVRTAYAEIFQFFDPATDGEEKARDIFRHYEPLGQLTRIVRLFLGLSEEAGIIPEGARKPATIPNASGGRAVPKREKRPATAARSGSSTTQARARTPDHALLPTPIAALLGSLPADGIGWTQSRRDEFLKAFGAVLDFTVPIVSTDSAVTVDEDSE
jgi:hypothetical protein